MMDSGTYKYADRSTYVGDFTNNFPDIWEKFTWGNGSSYEGQFVDGRMSGDGTFIHYNNSTILKARFTEWEYILNRMIFPNRFYYKVHEKFYYRFPEINKNKNKISL